MIRITVRDEGGALDVPELLATARGYLSTIKIETSDYHTDEAERWRAMPPSTPGVDDKAVKRRIAELACDEEWFGGPVTCLIGLTDEALRLKFLIGRKQVTAVRLSTPTLDQQEAAKSTMSAIHETLATRYPNSEITIQ